jgi:hypothetical protein
VPALLPFAQLDLPGRLALSDARYVVRPPMQPDADPDVLAIRVLGAQRARRKLRRGKPTPLAAEPDAPPLPLTRITLIKARPFDEAAAADAWLERILADRELWSGLVEEMIATVNRGICAYRATTLDGLAGDLHAEAAVAVRFGYGSGDEVAEGRWSAARELSEGSLRELERNLDTLAGEQSAAASLAGREPEPVAEGLVADARRDLTAGRLRGAALRLRLALDELEREGTRPEEGREALERATRAIRGGGEPDRADVETAARTLSRAVRGASAAD